jgi:hypothetical protein
MHTRPTKHNGQKLRAESLTICEHGWQNARGAHFWRTKSSFEGTGPDLLAAKDAGFSLRRRGFESRSGRFERRE